MTISKAQLDASLEAWAAAESTFGFEQQASSLASQSHKDLIASMRSNGHTWTQANAELYAISAGHQKAVLDAWANMNRCYNEYQTLRAKYKSQTP